MTDLVRLCLRQEGADCRAYRLVETMRRAGYDVSVYDAERAWLDYSETYAAGWLNDDDADEVVSAIRARCDPIEHDGGKA